MDTRQLRDEARRRVRDTPELNERRDEILPDWADGAEHWRWLATAPVSEILTWAASLFEGHEIGEPRSAERYRECADAARELERLLASLPEAERQLPENRGCYNRLVELERLARYHKPALEAELAVVIAQERADRLARQQAAPGAGAGAPERPYISSADLAETYRARGLSLSRAWSQYVRDTILQPIVRSDAVDLPAFARSYNVRGGGS